MEIERARRSKTPSKKINGSFFLGTGTNNDILRSRHVIRPRSLTIIQKSAGLSRSTGRIYRHSKEVDIYNNNRGVTTRQRVVIIAGT